MSSRIAVLRALPGLGDLLCAQPALRALRRRFPDAHITFIGPPEAGRILGRTPDLVDDHLPVSWFPGLIPGPPALHRLTGELEAARERRFDLAVGLHGSGQVSNVLLTCLGARRLAGAHPPGRRAPRGTFISYPDHLPEIRRMTAVVAALGAPVADESLSFPVWPEDERAMRSLLAGWDPDGEWPVVVHAGASLPERRWSAEGFATVAGRLAEAGHPIVLTGGPGEVGLVDRIASRLDRPPLDLAGRTPLGVLAALLRRASVVVTNDTGVSHLAAAVRAPSVVVFPNSDPARWAPLDRTRHRPVPALGRPVAEVVEEVLDRAYGHLAANGRRPSEVAGPWSRR